MNTFLFENLDIYDKITSIFVVGQRFQYLKKTDEDFSIHLKATIRLKRKSRSIQQRNGGPAVLFTLSNIVVIWDYNLRIVCCFQQKHTHEAPLLSYSSPLDQVKRICHHPSRCCSFFFPSLSLSREKRTIQGKYGNQRIKTASLTRCMWSQIHDLHFNRAQGK